jgi:hypothetical protein
MDTQTEKVTLTEAEAEVLHQARHVLKALQERTWRAGWSGGDDRQRAACLGRVAGDAERAESAVFEALNSASSYLDDEAAEAATRTWLESPSYDHEPS